VTPTTVSGLPDKVLRLAAVSCIAIAVACVAASLAIGSASLGVALAAGLLLGAINNRMIAVLMNAGMPIGATSMLRLVVISTIVLFAALTTPLSVTAALAFGVGMAELALAGSAVAVSRR
jgi:hypothetical protein